MYNIIRLIISCIFLVCSIIAIKNSKVIRKHILYIVFTSLSGILFVVLAFLPFENLFVTFDSPKAAYEYFNLGKSNIELIVEGNDSDLIINRKNGSDTYLIIPKTADGWKIGIGSNTKRVVQKVSNGIVLYVYQYKDTSDYFITILDTNGGESTVSDEYNTKFFSLERYNDSLEKNFVTYYAHITNLNPQYSVIVNDNKIVLGNQ
ncbi:MAG: hypothetical protein E7562_07095 [Ruminococcaceae bacterium]|nr:hypothetical protein [Oscillospiraceae bacterium]